VVGEIVPLSSPASAVAILNVEPVEYRPFVARLNSGEPACSPNSAS
jgi:hypothetical protein